MTVQLDILTVDANIRKSFEDEIEKLPEHRHTLEDLDTTLENDNLRKRVRSSIEKARCDLAKYISELESQKNMNFYLMETLPYIEEYKQILKTPVKVSFMDKATKVDKQKRRIVERYLSVASQYVDIEYEKPSKTKRIVCANCSNKKEFDILDGNTYVCTECYAKQYIMKHNSCYSDIDRVNISSKYMYDPKIHFRDCIKQYQGKQNCTIPQKVYDDLEDQFERHHLLVSDPGDSQEVRFKKITKNNIMIFLKELGYSKHYENVHLIHYMLTGVKPDDISHLEDQLLDDFDVLIDLYHKRFKDIKRKNFINTQYVLYQLLRRHKHSCKKEEFIILKTIDRKLFHDDICKTLFQELGWNHSPFY